MEVKFGIKTEYVQ